MNILLISVVAFFLLLKVSAQQVEPVIVIHGGAGTIRKDLMTADQEKAYQAKLQEALNTGMAVLKKGGSSLDAVETAIKILEDSPLFNAGKGAVFTNEGKNELDAAIMEGKTLKAGSVASVMTVKNPIAAARAVMEKSEHVMMIGRGAEQFAKEQGLEIVDNSYFYTEDRFQQLKKAKEKEEKKTPGSGKTDKTTDEKYGTVGCVALDTYGNLAAGTSTGGMTNKKYNRVGDAPIIGCGTYADNNTCAVSATGWGEYFIRSVVAHDIAALVAYKKMSVQKAGITVLKKVADLGGDGGVIILDRKGNIAMPFNSEGMYRGYLKADGETQILIYK
jgi:L-asparaginase / beta-aspartyl-peptidase